MSSDTMMTRGSGSADFFGNLTIAIAGDLGDGWNAATVARWVTTSGGTFTHGVDEQITHLLATPEQYKDRSEKVLQAMELGTAHIVSKSWLEDCLWGKKLHKEGSYSLAEAENREVAEKFVDINLYHVYRDETNFSYEITLRRTDEELGDIGERYELYLWESQTTPTLYRFAAKYYEKRHAHPTIYRPHDVSGSLKRELDEFRSVFKETTGIDWDDRVTLKGTMPFKWFQYEPPTGGQPVGYFNEWRDSDLIKALTVGPGKSGPEKKISGQAVSVNGAAHRGTAVLNSDGKKDYQSTEPGSGVTLKRKRTLKEYQASRAEKRLRREPDSTSINPDMESTAPPQPVITAPPVPDEDDAPLGGPVTPPETDANPSVNPLLTSSDHSDPVEPTPKPDSSRKRKADEFAFEDHPEFAVSAAERVKRRRETKDKEIYPSPPLPSSSSSPPQRQPTQRSLKSAAPTESTKTKVKPAYKGGSEESDEDYVPDGQLAMPKVQMKTAAEEFVSDDDVEDDDDEEDNEDEDDEDDADYEGDDDDDDEEDEPAQRQAKSDSEFESDDEDIPVVSPEEAMEQWLGEEEVEMEAETGEDLDGAMIPAQRQSVSESDDDESEDESDDEEWPEEEPEPVEVDRYRDFFAGDWFMSSDEDEDLDEAMIPAQRQSISESDEDESVDESDDEEWLEEEPESLEAGRYPSPNEEGEMGAEIGAAFDGAMIPAQRQSIYESDDDESVDESDDQEWPEEVLAPVEGAAAPVDDPAQAVAEDANGWFAFAMWMDDPENQLPDWNTAGSMMDHIDDSREYDRAREQMLEDGEYY
ncbi:hypothetical protein F4677DRAFT_461363 [Hypoxylon crocopeplum]|nr:hypothetical protein F4677DRAFT_461363 [Hypoxylon crocopeplum]